jgi:predicted NAD/FAD-binding protein
MGAAGLAVLGPRVARRSPRRGRVAIVGAGTGGVAAAYFLAGTYDVEVFEARARIGGHCDSRVMRYRGRRVVVDLGAQFFHPDTHPIYVTLLEDLGLSGETLEATAGLCIFPVAGGPPVFSSSHALATPERAIDFADFTQLARQAVLSGLPWTTTVGAWIRGLPVRQAFKDEVLVPWISATIGSSEARALRTSARSILQTFALAFPADLSRPATTFTSRIGLQGNLQRMLDRSPRVRVHLKAPVRALTRDRDGWILHTPAGRRGPFRHVLLNAPPRVGRKLLRPLPAFACVTELLEAYRYFDARLVIHTDPAYVQHDRDNWAAYNAGVDGRRCEGSVWLGALQDRLPSGATVDVFKSWASRRRADPRHIVAERRFQHPLITRSAIDAARALGLWQGHRGLYFSGQYTTGADLQETAVYSAMRVAQCLAPCSRSLASLESLLAARGLAGVSYDL